MTMSPVGAMVLAAALVAPPQTQVTPPPLPNTPAECLRVIGQWFNQRQREAGSGLTSEFIRQITEQRAAMAKACVAPFDLQTAAVSDLPILAQLYAQAGQKDLSKAALDRALGQKGMTEGDRATVLVDAIRLGLSESKSPERNAQLERYVDELDAMSNAVFNQKLSAHTNLNGYYRADDIDAGIIKHSQWIIAAGDAATPADRQKLAIPVVSAHNNLAQVWAGQGKTAEALALLEGVLENWKDAPASTLAYLASTIERYRLVGTPGAAITAPRWLNASGGATALPMTGKVTLLEFTAHWCGPCKESYPGLKRLLARYGPQGFRVVMATQLYEFFASERPLAPEVEIERDREYFKKEGMDVPIAIGDKATSVRNADGTYTPGNPNDANYRVGGIPQIHLIDKAGRIRLIMVGYDDANEPAIAKMIEQLLAEK